MAQPRMKPRMLAVRLYGHFKRIAHVVPGSVPRRLASKQENEIPRSFAQSWRTYIRGSVVSQHAQRIITQFMSTCCGKSTTVDEDIDAVAPSNHVVPDNTVPLARVHRIIDQMSERVDQPRGASKNPKDLNDGEEGPVDEIAVRMSTQMQGAMEATAKLWPRTGMAWPTGVVDQKHVSINLSNAAGSAAATKRKGVNAMRSPISHERIYAGRRAM